MRKSLLLVSLLGGISGCPNEPAVTSPSASSSAKPASESGDFVVRADAGSAAPITANGSASDTYVYIAKRPLAVVGLAEARAMSNADAKSAVSHIADALDACVTDAGRTSGTAPAGVARIVAQIAPDGSVAGTNLTVAPGGAVLAIALRCLDAPIKLMSFPPSTETRRGFAIEVKWGL